jgi:hypothetical protein
VLAKHLHDFVLRGFTGDCGFDERAVSLRHGHSFAFYRERNSATGFRESVKLRVVDLLYRGLLTYVRNDAGSD